MAATRPLCLPCEAQPWAGGARHSAYYRIPARGPAASRSSLHRTARRNSIICRCVMFNARQRIYPRPFVCPGPQGRTSFYGSPHDDAGHDDGSSFLWICRSRSSLLFRRIAHTAPSMTPVLRHSLSNSPSSSTSASIAAKREAAVCPSHAAASSAASGSRIIPSARAGCVTA